MVQDALNIYYHNLAKIVIGSDGDFYQSHWGELQRKDDLKGKGLGRTIWF